MSRASDVAWSAKVDLEALRDAVDESVMLIEDYGPDAVVQVLEQLRVLRDGIGVLMVEYARKEGDDAQE